MVKFGLSPPRRIDMVAGRTMTSLARDVRDQVAVSSRPGRRVRCHGRVAAEALSEVVRTHRNPERDAFGCDAVCRSRWLLSCPGVIPSRGPLGEVRQAVLDARGARLGLPSLDRHERDAVFARADRIVEGQRIRPISGGPLNGESIVADLIRPLDVRILWIAYGLAVQPLDEGLRSASRSVRACPDRLCSADSPG